ncbi:hypothetical protein KEM54_005543 [Ascosphaera aggregata]|nr:hypothetical protein KEM54_005543 [Ascosphaera aggregata]
MTSSLFEWDPTVFLDPSISPTNPYILIILNTPLNGNVYKILRKKACYVVCVDGGTNRFFAVMKQFDRLSTELPDVIVGDLDSIKSDVRLHYESLGVDIQHVPEQLSTDFGKALRLVNHRRKDILKAAGSASSSRGGGTREVGEEQEQTKESKLDVIVMGGLGGRLDQAIAQLHHLYRASSNKDPTDHYYQNGDIYLFSESSISFFLPPGRNYIYTKPKQLISQLPPSFPHYTPLDDINAITAPTLVSWPTDHPYLMEASALLPLGKPTVITSRGFQWDVTNWKSSFEDQISTSNHLRSDVISVDSSWWVLFSAELADRSKLWRE